MEDIGSFAESLIFKELETKGPAAFQARSPLEEKNQLDISDVNLTDDARDVLIESALGKKSKPALVKEDTTMFGNEIPQPEDTETDQTGLVERLENLLVEFKQILGEIDETTFSGSFGMRAGTTQKRKQPKNSARKELRKRGYR
jgi:hypothetical protein